MFKVTIPDDPDLPLKEEDKHQTEKILEAPVTVGVDLGKNDETVEQEFIVTAPEDFITQNDMETIFRSAIPNLIQFVDELNLPEKAKVIGKLREALELFNTK